MEISAAVVEPVGLNAYWFLKDSGAGGSRRAGYMYMRTRSFSRVRERTGVIDIGRKSAQVMGLGTLGIGSMEAHFH